MLENHKERVMEDAIVVGTYFEEYTQTVRIRWGDVYACAQNSFASSGVLRQACPKANDLVS
jgi:hypothetical protein